MEFKDCDFEETGSLLNETDATRKPLGFNDYPRFSVTTDVVILTTIDKPQENNRKIPEKAIQILLMKRDTEPYKGKWSLPGGFVCEGQELTKTVKSKVKEKTGVSDFYMEQLCTYGDNIKRDPRAHVMTVAYLALAQKEEIVKNKQKANKENCWFTILTTRADTGEVLDFKLDNGESILNSDSLAFDHKMIIIDGLNRIFNKLTYTNIGAYLVNDLFTVKELQLVYEVFLGRKIDSFRRFMGAKIIETDQMTDGKAHRPAKLFRYKRTQL